jgi:epsilon-lactone hydrolase
MPQAEIEQVRQHWLDLADALAPPAGIPEYREGFEKLCATFPVDPDATVESVDADGVPALMVSTPDATGTTILWTHSGGYVFGSAHGYRAFGALLSRAAKARVLLVDYRLAPENTYPAARDDAMAAYRWLIAQGTASDKIVIGGDSAGGGLALSTLLAIRDSGGPQPGAGVAVSPVADMTVSGESMKSRQHLDPVASPEMLAGLGGMYRGDVAETDPGVSPLFGDYRGLPPLLVLVGTDEVLHDDATRVVEKATAAGVDARLLVGENQAHIWPLFASILPEGQEALDEIGRFVQQATK